MFFLLKQLNDTEPKLIGNFRQWYTINFSEGYCFNEIVKYSFTDYDARYFDDELKAMGVVGPPDCYLRYDQNVFLLENKDILIGANIKSGYDFEVLIEEIKKKLLAEGKKQVGVGQIVTNMRKLLTGENTFDNGLAVNDANIFPVIVLHDPMFDAPGLNKVMNSFYQEELKKLEVQGIPTGNLKPLTLINIDTLIQLAPAFKNKQVTLKELLEAYPKLLKGAEGIEGLSFDQAEHLVREATTPFSIFAINYMQAKFGGKWRSEELFAEMFRKSGID